MSEDVRGHFDEMSEDVIATFARPWDRGVIANMTADPIDLIDAASPCLKGSCGWVVSEAVMTAREVAELVSMPCRPSTTSHPGASFPA